MRKKLLIPFALSISLTSGILSAAEPEKSAVPQTSGTITVEGELLREDLEGGMWNLKPAAGGELYDLHGDVPFQDGDWVRVTGVRQDKLLCMHLRGTILQVKSMEAARAPRTGPGWVKFQRSAVCFGEDGSEVKTLHLARRKKILGSFEESEKSDQIRFKEIVIGKNGEYAGVIFLDNTFKYLDGSARVLWEKPQTVWAIPSPGGNFIALSIRDPQAPKHRPIEEVSQFAAIFSTGGALVMGFDEAPMLARDTLYFTPSGRYGYVKVYKTIEGTIFFDTTSGKKKVYEGLGVPKVSEDGSFQILGKTGAASDVKEIYRGKVD